MDKKFFVVSFFGDGEQTVVNYGFECESFSVYFEPSVSFNNGMHIRIYTDAGYAGFIAYDCDLYAPVVYDVDSDEFCGLLASGKMSLGVKL